MGEAKNKLKVMQEQLLHRDRMLWLLAQQAGGRLTVHRETLEKFPLDRAQLYWWGDPETGDQIVEARTAEPGKVAVGVAR